MVKNKDISHITNVQKLINNNNWTKIYKYLTTNRLKPNFELSNGNTIIHMAAINNEKKILLYYLKNNTTPLLKSNDNGDTPIHLLAIYNYTETLKKCIHHNEEFLNLLNNNNETISNILYNNLDFIKYICNQNINLINDDIFNNNIIIKNIDANNNTNDDHYKIIKLLFKKQKQFINDYNNSFLCYALNNNKIRIAKLFIDNNYDINKQDNSYITPLIYAIKNKQHDILQKLFDKKVNIEYYGAEGDNNPMLYAITNNDEYTINLLIEHKFDLNKYNRFLEIPLHNALTNKKLSIEILTKLIYYSDLNIQNLKGETPLHELCKYHDYNNYSNVLSHKKLDIFAKDNLKKRPIDYLNGHTINNFVNLVIKSYCNQIIDPNYAYIFENIIKCKNNVNSDECKYELKKYIFATQRSVPVSQDKININMKLVSGKNVNYGLFNADALHNMVYTMIMLKKYKNMCVPFQYLFNDKYINTKMSNYNLFNLPSENMVYELVQIYTNYFFEIQPYLIIWKNKNVNYVHKDFKFLIKKCLVSDKIRYIFIKLTLIPSLNNTHANILVYDKITNVLERFEPYGLIPYLDGDNLNKFIEKIGKECIDPNVKYMKPIDMDNIVGPQVISNDSNYNIKKSGDPNGYCLAWTFWFLEMRINNPDTTVSELMKNTIGTIVKSNSTDGEKLFISFIRNYAAELDKEKNNFMISAGISINNIYDLSLNDDNLKKLLKKLRYEFNLIVKERI